MNNDIISKSSDTEQTTSHHNHITERKYDISDNSKELIYISLVLITVHDTCSYS